MDCKTFKATNSEGGTLTAQVTVGEVTTIHLTPVPNKAPGTITVNSGTALEEEIFYKNRDAVAGTITGLTRDYSNLNGGTGRQHENGNPWETLQSVSLVNNLVDAVQEGYIGEIQSVAYVSASSFTVATDRTGYYTAGRTVRINQSGSLIGVIASSSYAAGTGLTTVNTTGVTVPNPVTTIELAIEGKNSPAKATLTGTETLTNKTLTSPTINGTPTFDSTALSVIYSGSMSRQAIMNGNFDVAQRNPALNSTFGVAHNTFGPDHWSVNHAISVLSSFTRQAITPGELHNSYYHARLTTTSAYANPGVAESVGMRQKVENGTRLLAGDGKKLTLSFYARSSIASQKLGFRLQQHYGTGGSPTAVESLAGNNVTLTSSWQNVTYTFTTNTLTGKTFGTANDDYIQVDLYSVWGSNFADQFGGVTSGMGIGNIDIAQVQLCAGEVALPFQPKSFEEELRACQRYCWVPDLSMVNTVVGFGTSITTTAARIMVNLPVTMRIIPTPTVTAGDYQLNDGATLTDVTVLANVAAGQFNGNNYWFQATVASGLTQYRPVFLISDATADRKMILSAEL